MLELANGATTMQGTGWKVAKLQSAAAAPIS